VASGARAIKFSISGSLALTTAGLLADATLLSRVEPNGRFNVRDRFIRLAVGTPSDFNGTADARRRVFIDATAFTVLLRGGPTKEAVFDLR
jgi:hypothetical protein